MLLQFMSGGLLPDLELDGVAGLAIQRQDQIDLTATGERLRNPEVDLIGCFKKALWAEEHGGHLRAADVDRHGGGSETHAGAEERHVVAGLDFGWGTGRTAQWKAES